MKFLLTAALALAGFLQPALMQAQTPHAQAPQTNSPIAPQTHSPRDSLHVRVNLVTVPLTVIGANGGPISGLRPQDFTLTENGHPETIRLFEQNSSRPLSVVLAIDTSLSVHKDLSLEKQAAYGFLHALLRPTDRVELLGFAGEVTEIVPFTSNIRRLDQGLKQMHGEGPTALYEAVVRGSQEVQWLQGRRIIVVISDGSNSMTGVDYRQAREAALRARASIESVILVPIAASAGRDLGGEHALIQLSRDTGGQYFYARASGELPDALTQLSQSLRSEYLLGYYPVSVETRLADGFRQIHVQMKNSMLNAEYRLHCRTGYYANPEHESDILHR